ncbi:Ras family protein, putative [Ichthyophthirius multifiliis]|uniref:Ras family protein, putative n=1 Tax=Ichthyophthirius multifiliis TaxID=5932 RepID=G0QK92_ICHMU|nr:Ras family protein, putative [Ichthyophthirius multifiliis]EGR34368.1 Ras family protein, putative [Ichthyophthirius multifiliis]|eukprot:XP_004039672.1 Ras family protein, putative [Ichthyophthirius multifiliis]
MTQKKYLDNFIQTIKAILKFNKRPGKLNISQPKDTKRFKVLVLGDGNVGKSQILDRYISDQFDHKYKPTIAIDYKNKVIEQQKEIVQLNFWDFSGHPEFYEVRNEFYKESNAIILIFDVGLKRSLDGLDLWLREANDCGVQGLPTIVLGNKNDTSIRVVSEQEGFQWAKSRQFDYFDTSAYNGRGIEEAFKELIQKLLKAQ